MKKHEFLKKLNRLLKHLSRSERKKILSYYDDMIEDYMERGYWEEEAVRKIETPDAIVEKIKLDSLKDYEIMEEPKRISGGYAICLILFSPIWCTMLLLIGYLLLCIIFSFWSGILMIATFTILFMLAGGISIIGLPVVMTQDGIGVGIVQLGVGIFMIGISGLAIPFTINSTKNALDISKRIIKWYKNKVIKIVWRR